MSDQFTYCTFRVDQLHLAVEVTHVQEVIREQPMTRVPCAPPVVRGVMNLRGQIVTALDLRQRIGLPEPEVSGSMMNVVIRTSEGPVSLLVDEICDVLRVDPSRFEPVPETLQGVSRELICGTYKLDDRLLLLLNVESTLSFSA